MGQGSTTIAGIKIPSTDPVFLAIVGVHVVIALVCVVSGLIAMLSSKRRGRHSKAGTVYYWCLAALFASATVLAIMRWEHSWHLFVIGTFAFGAATWGRTAMRQHWTGWVSQHIMGMGISYVLMLVAFYVDNGPNIPLWKDLPHFTYWALPVVIGALLILRTLLRHPLMTGNRKAVEAHQKDDN